MRIKFNGLHYEITKEMVQREMKGVEPETGRRFFVVVDGVSFPIKQVFGVVLDVPGAAFSTGYAYNVLSRLGIEIIDVCFRKVG